MADETKIQWHPAFCSAMQLTLMENASSLDYNREFNLSSKPLQVDLLVINKENDQPVHDEVGRIFRRHNLLEYKSPGDDLNIDTYYKVIGYGCLYKALAAKHVNEIKADEITLTLVRREKPEDLFRMLVEAGTEVSSNYPGIYHLRGNTTFETQIISTKELPEGSHIWLRALTRNIDAAEATQFVSEMAKLPEGSEERRLADSVLQVTMSANYGVFENLKKEDPIMCDALRELMKPELEEEVRKAVGEATDKAYDKGADNNKVETAERMIRKDKYSDTEIADISGLTVKQIQKMKNKTLNMK